MENACVEMKAGFCEEFSGICCTVTTKRTKEMKEPLRVLIIVFHLVPQSLWFSIRLHEQEPLRPDLYHSVRFFRRQKGTKIYNVIVHVGAAKYQIPTKGRKLRSSLGNKTI